MFRGIEHFAIASPDPRQLAEFYVNALEFNITFELAGSFLLEDGNGGLIEIIPSEGERPPGTLRTPGMRHIAIAVGDFDAAYASLQGKGVIMEGAPYVNSGNRLVFFRDLDGNLLHLIQREKPLP